MEKNRCGDTVKGGVSAAVDQLFVWQMTARRQAEALRRAAAAAQVVQIMWEHLTEDERQKIENDQQLREQIRQVTGFYGFNCT